MQNTQILNAHQVEFNILAVVNDITSKVPDETYSFFIENSFYYLQYIPVVEFDRETGELLDFSVSASDYGDFLCRLGTERFREKGWQEPCESRDSRTDLWKLAA